MIVELRRSGERHGAERDQRDCQMRRAQPQSLAPLHDEMIEQMRCDRAAPAAPYIVTLRDELQERTDLNERIKRKILGENARRVYGFQWGKAAAPRPASLKV